jgi:MFS family permease
VLAAAYPAGTFAAALPAGWLAARWGVKPTLLLGLGLLGGTSLVFAFAHTIVLLDLARFAQGVGGACMWAAGMAWLVTAAPPERRGELIGSALAAAIIGVLLGPVLGGAATVVGPEVVFSLVAVVAGVLAGFAWATPGVRPEPGAVLAPLAMALRSRPVLAGFWLFTLPALFAGVIEVLGPLRLDDLGASGAVIGGIFLITAAAEAVISPIAGRLSDRRGRYLPIRAGLTGALVMAVLLPLPGSVAVLGLAILFAFAALGSFWAPAMALLSDASEETGLDQALAFSISNLAWAVGHLIGASAGGAVAELSSDAVPYGALALITAVTLAALTVRGRRRLEPA